MSNTLPSTIIDSHQHFWSAVKDLGWPAYMPQDYLDDAASLRSALRATVFLECNTHYDPSLPIDLQSTGETKFAAQIGNDHAAAPIRLAAAVVAHADPFTAVLPFDRVLDAHRAASSGRLRAIRRSVAWDEDESFNYPMLKTQAHMLADPRFVRALHSLADRDLAFETWVYHPQLDELTALAKAVPACTVVLDHAGTMLAAGRYAQASGAFEDWKESMARLAGERNVHVKIGGLLTSGSKLDGVRQQLGLDRWTVPALAEALAPWLDHLIGEFGPERCLFESNFPVDKAHCDLSVLVEAYSLALSGLDDTARAAIFAGNAARVYRIELSETEMSVRRR